MPTIALLGTLDTKGEEHVFVAEYLKRKGFQTLLVDVGSSQEGVVRADVPAAEVAAFTGEDWRAVFARRDRGECVALMARAAPLFLADAVSRGRIHGVISLGGGGGTAIATAAMQALPVGFPKVMVTTLASGNTAPYVGTKDVVLFPAVVDVSGINRVSRPVFENAAGAIAGMVEAAEARKRDALGERPLVVASMFGNTTVCVNKAKELMESAGYEVLVFHATGTGGRAMEHMIGTGLVSGVLDVTTTEWADELVGGILSAGPERLEAAGRERVPTIVTPGCLDMVNFGEPKSVPAKFAKRQFYFHNPQVTLMRTSPSECRKLGAVLAAKVNAYRGPVSVLLPLRALSIISVKGQPFHDAKADQALFDAVRADLDPRIPLMEMDVVINDPSFAEACAKELLRLMHSAGTDLSGP
jgi:uncharacterized protein (UPF0261 family)